ncbi:HGGxSTG domain-containing protein [Aneurinibacillus aneurinilyticus]|uniref:HGGxSTG domain-containing protein n=1 Tax=Aneurinibacillus aneurinilyticus TaxID=1391 RepID=UPI0023F68265|nr:HGGxSTG domain-containing protein [Aneurinibacillus aneurinilyticus]MCI1696912.1 hypothetical protein [Aneurinibacillus aneurinilyticus]
MMRGQTTICSAITRKGTSCHNIPMKNGRCRMHGGKVQMQKTAKGCIETKTPQATKQGLSQGSMKP